MNYVFGRLPQQLGRLPSRAAVWSVAVASPTSRASPIVRRAIASSLPRWDDEYAKKAQKLNQRGLDEHEQEVKAREHQIKRPWHRQDADKPPVTEDGDEKAKPPAKGKLLTTPTRLLKLILPLPMSIEKDKDNNSKEYGRSISPNDEIQPLALLVHPQQPLSYVERLIQAELPPVVEDGREKMPSVYFRAEDTGTNEPDNKEKNKKKTDSGGPHVAKYSGLGHEAADEKADADKKWVRWSSSTEMGDFIRDAARGREFAVEIEGYNVEMRVGVPSFNDRTHYMRLRLRKMSKQIDSQASLKHECDQLAHRGAHRLAKGGFGLLAGWWAIVYYITFQTEYGWDLVEPVTYLAGLTTIMGGYLWFLYISRDLSYKAAMNLTVSRRQSALYEAKGFNVQKWDGLLQEANALRREIKTVAVEYDVDWDEMKDLGGKDVKKLLEKERKKSGKDDEEEDEDDDGDEDDTEKEKEQEQGKEQKKDEGEKGDGAAEKKTS